MNIFVGNLNPETTADSLRTLFSEFGEVMSSKIIFDNATGMSRGFGFVEMSSLGASQDAIDNLDMSYYEGNIISVKEAKQNNTGNNNRGNNFRGGGGQRGGGGYNQNRPQQYGTSPSGRPLRPRTPRPDGGGYNNPNREGGYNNPNREGGYNNPNRDGGYNPNREGGYNNPNRDNNYNRDYNNRDNRDRDNRDYNKDFNKNY